MIIPDGYDLVGFAIVKNADGSIDCLDFTIWKPDLSFANSQSKDPLRNMGRKA